MYILMLGTLLAVVMATPVRAQVRRHRHPFPRPAPAGCRPRDAAGPVRAARAGSSGRSRKFLLLQRAILGLPERRMVCGSGIQWPVDRRCSPVRPSFYLARTNAVLPCPAWTLAPVGSPPTSALAWGVWAWVGRQARVARPRARAGGRTRRESGAWPLARL